MRSRILAVVLLAGLAAPVRAEAPAGRYAVLETTVKDRRTTLTWQRAVSPDRLSWAAANVACGSIRGGKWRLPTVAELLTIVDVRAAGPAIDGTAFPDTPTITFWTSTPFRPASGSYWAVDFATGGSVGAPESSALSVRCVQEATSGTAPPP